jgi:YidC/Oxa1 family membrane protein insertase
MDRRTVFFLFSITFAFLTIRLGFHFFEGPKDRELRKPPQERVLETKEQPSYKKPLPLSEPQEPAKALPSQDSYLILENSYQQLVISAKGGAIAELNLPFKSPTSPKSVVLPIEFDSLLNAQEPKICMFPLHEALAFNGKKIEPKKGGYYPLLRRSYSTFQLAPKLFACNVVSDYPEVAELNYEVKKHTERELILEASQPHRRITKRYILPENPNDLPYCFTLEVKIEGDSRGLYLTSGLPEIEWISGSSGAIIKYHVIRGNSSSVEKIDLPKEVFNLSSVAPDWVCNSNGFFGIILDPVNSTEAGFRVERIAGAKAPSRLFFLDRSSNRFPLNDLYAFNVLIPLKLSSETLIFRIFSGPFAESILKTVDNTYAKEDGGKDSDYLSCQTFHGWFAFISQPFAKFIFFLMKVFHTLFDSWALSIILVTIVLRVLLYPLNAWSLRSTKGMQIVGPQIKAIQERYKKDPQKSQQEILKVYKEHHVNPFSGCLPLIIQMPFLIGMFDLLKSAFELRGAAWIPGWINDLSAPDVLFSWNFSIPLIGNEFHLLPVFLGGIMYLQQNMMSGLPKDPQEWTDQQKQQRQMGTIMTVVMTVMFYQFPSGLNIYWISSMLLGIVQQWWTYRIMEKAKQSTKPHTGTQK